MSNKPKVFDDAWCLEVTTRLTAVETKLHMLSKVWVGQGVLVAIGFIGVIVAIVFS